MSHGKIECFDDLYQVIENKENEIILVDEIWALYNNYDRYHDCENHKNLNEFQNRYRKDHQIMYFLLEKLYMVNCADSYLISTVIKRIHTEGIRFNHIISDLFKESKYFKTNEILQMLEYFLKYSYMNKMLFNGSRMASVDHFFPIMLLPKSHYTSCLPKIIGILLRYGMFLDPITGQAPILDQIILGNTLLHENPNFPEISLWYSIVNGGILKSNPLFLPENNLPNKRKQIFSLSVETANVFMRDSVQFNLSVFLLPMKKQQEFLKKHTRQSDIKHKRANIVHFIHKLGRFIPQLSKRCLEPTSLKHSCKQVIRKMLHLCWQLPNGLFHLNLPMPLIRYLNLEID